MRDDAPDFAPDNHIAVELLCDTATALQIERDEARAILTAVEERLRAMVMKPSQAEVARALLYFIEDRRREARGEHTATAKARDCGEGR
jgi:hypothetical protein